MDYFIPMSSGVYQSWPSVIDGKQCYLVATDHSLHVHLKAPLGIRPGGGGVTDEEVQESFPEGVKSMDRRDLHTVEWNPEQLRLSLVGAGKKIHIPFRRGLEEIGDAYFRELAAKLPELGPVVEAEQVFLDRHAGAVLNVLGFSMAALILWWMQVTDDPLKYEGRRKGAFEVAKSYVVLTGGWGVVGVAIAGVVIAARKYWHRKRNPVPMFVARRIG